MTWPERVENQWFALVGEVAVQALVLSIAVPKAAILGLLVIDAALVGGAFAASRRGLLKPLPFKHWWVVAALMLAAIVGTLGFARSPDASNVLGASLLFWSVSWGARLVPERGYLSSVAGWAALVLVLSAGFLDAAAARPLVLATWAVASTVASWAVGRVVARQADWHRLIAAHQARIAAFEQEQMLFQLHDRIERAADGWGPPEWSTQVLKPTADVLQLSEVLMLVRNSDESGWSVYASWPTSPRGQPQAEALADRLPAIPQAPERDEDVGSEVCCLDDGSFACAVRAPVGGRWGWLILRRPTSRPRLAPAEQQLFAGICRRLSAAVRNVQTYTESRRRAQHLAMLHEISRAMARPLQLEPLFETIFREVSGTMPVEAFIIALYEPENESVRAAFIFDKGKRYPPVTVKADSGPTVDVIRTGKPLFINRRRVPVLEPVPGARLIGAPEDPPSILIVPMTLEERVLGAISAQAYHPDAYTPEDLELLGTVASQAAIYIENARLYEQTVELALTDFMTGLGNARMMRQELTRELARANRSDRPFALLMIDSDDFKQINDRYGHPVGDRYLVLLADVVRSQVRVGDVVTRYAGDEFILILPEADATQARLVGERIVKAVASTPLVVNPEQRVYSTVSVGVAVFPESGSTEDALVWAVDRALYASKKRGKGCVTVFSSRTGGPALPRA